MTIVVVDNFKNYNMNYTTIEQSKKLVELGLNPDTADMGYNGIKDRCTRKIIYDKIANTIPNMNAIPCWSLGALLEVMPKVISIPVDDRSAYFYTLEWQFANDNSLRYIATNRGKCLIDIYSDHDIGSKSFIEIAFEMVVWLIENGYINTEKK